MTPDWAHAEELDALAEERDEARRELERLKRKYDDHDRGLDRWCDWQDRVRTVIGEMGVTAEFDRRLGWENPPLCRHERELDELRSAARVVVSDFERELDRLRATDARPYGLTEYGVGGMETLQQFEGDVARVRALLGVEDTNTTQAAD